MIDETGIQVNNCHCPDPCLRPVYNVDLSYATLSKHSLDVLLEEEQKGVLSEQLIRASEMNSRVKPDLFQETTALFNNISESYGRFMMFSSDKTFAKMTHIESAMKNLLDIATNDIIAPMDNAIHKYKQVNGHWSKVELLTTKSIDDSVSSLAYLSTLMSTPDLQINFTDTNLVDEARIMVGRTELALQWWNQVEKEAAASTDPWMIKSIWTTPMREQECNSYKAEFSWNLQQISHTALQNFTHVDNHTEVLAIISKLVNLGIQIKHCLTDFPTSISEITHWLDKFEKEIHNQKLVVTRNLDMLDADALVDKADLALNLILEQGHMYFSNQTTRKKMATDLTGGLINNLKYLIEGYTLNITKTVLSGFKTDIQQARTTIGASYRDWLFHLATLQSYHRKTGLEKYVIDSVVE